MTERRPIGKFIIWIGAALILALVLDLVLFGHVGGTNAPAIVATSVNSQWTPHFQTFNGIEMAEVPAGCFDMGSDNGYADAKPVTKICFDSPFWIDKTEVTQAQFKQLGGQAAKTPGFPGDDQPVETITWFEARDFCVKRGGRLPTEAEWEYVARGPDDLVYPWGNTFDAKKAIWNRPPSDGPAYVGAYVAGASWVGALDMIGNVWEWTSSLYVPYPYKNDQAHEDNSNTTSARVIRGSSWYYFNAEYLLAAFRGKNAPTSAAFTVGFRCVRSS